MQDGSAMDSQEVMTPSMSNDDVYLIPYGRAGLVTLAGAENVHLAYTRVCVCNVACKAHMCACTVQLAFSEPGQLPQPLDQGKNGSRTI